MKITKENIEALAKKYKVPTSVYFEECLVDEDKKNIKPAELINRIKAVSKKYKVPLDGLEIDIRSYSDYYDPCDRYEGIYICGTRTLVFQEIKTRIEGEIKYKEEQKKRAAERRKLQRESERATYIKLRKKYRKKE
jgi:hypothetical protein